MKIDGIGLPDKVFTRSGIAGYFKDRGLESCSSRKRKRIEGVIWNYYQEGMNAEAIAEKLNREGIRTEKGLTFTLVNTDKILRRMIRREGKSSWQIGSKQWPLIQDLIDKGLDTFEIVDDLNARGLKTGTGLSYSYSNLRKTMRRNGHMPPKKKQGGLTVKVKTMLENCRSEGFSSRQVVEKMVEDCLISADDTMARKRVYDSYRRTLVKRVLPENVPEDFRAQIGKLIEKGLDSLGIADELNRKGVTTYKGKPYHPSTVKTYCYTLGISLRTKCYLDAPDFKNEITVLLAAGKSSKEIAEHLNEQGFSTFNGRPFNQEDIRSLLNRQAMKASPHCRNDYILMEIRPLADARYHARTICRKLNAMGMKTVTGSKFKTRTVDHYLRMIKAKDGAAND